MSLPTLAVTAGEPAGIGPDLVLALANQQGLGRCVVIADSKLLRERIQHLGLSVTIRDYHPNNRRILGSLEVWHRPLAAPAIAGTLNTANAHYVLHTLEVAIDGCLRGLFDALITGPVHKGIINDAGIPFSGHTNYLAERTHTQQVVMMLVGGGMRVALATTHMPLRAVADAISYDNLLATLLVLHHDLVKRFDIVSPRILVAGLNPHAGESGHMGREEIDIIEPVLNTLRGKGMQLIGPLPADTLFSKDKLAQCDAILTMYHDQGLPVLKHASFGHGVNITLGLPMVRVSVDHGTALDLAATGRADPGSLLAAAALATQLCSRDKIRPYHHNPYEE